MPAQLFDVSPRGSSSYSVPTFSGLQRGLSDLGAGIGAGITQRRTKREEEERKRMERAALQAAFGTYGEGGREAVTAGIRSGAIDPAMMERLWPIMQADQAQRNADRTFGLQQQRFNAEQAARAAAAAREPERKMMKDAANRLRYVDTGEYVFDGVQVPEEAPDLKLRSFFDQATGQQRTLDISTQEGAAEARSLLGGGWVETKAIDRSAPGLTSGAETETQKDIIQIRDMADNLGRVQESVTPTKQSRLGRGKAKIVAGLEWFAPGMVPDAAKKESYDYSTFEANVANYQNRMINMLSGAAVSEPEAQRLMVGFPTVTDPPSTFAAKFNANAQDVESRMRSRLRELGDPEAETFSLPRMDPPKGDTTWTDLVGSAAGAVADAVPSVVGAANASPAPDAVTQDAAPPAAGGYEMPDLSAMTDAKQVRAEVFKVLQTPGMDPAKATEIIDRLEARAKELQNSEDSRLERIWKSIFGD